MAIVALVGAVPAPPPVITADVIRGLRAPDGSKPCAEGLRAALTWIGEKAIPFEEAVEKARRSRTVSDYVAWALAAIGDGYGSGSGSGSGYGSGYGDGDGDGDGSGSGYGDGDGYGDGSGSGYGYGYGSGYGYGYGSGYGYGAFL